MNWIGRIDSLINIVFTWKTSPVKTFADAQRIQSTLSGTGVGSIVSIFPTVMNNEDLQKLVWEVSNLSPALLEKVRAAYTTPRANWRT
jgi:hypothetical protein